MFTSVTRHDPWGADRVETLDSGPQSLSTADAPAPKFLTVNTTYRLCIKTNVPSGTCCYRITDSNIWQAFFHLFGLC